MVKKKQLKLRQVEESLKRKLRIESKKKHGYRIGGVPYARFLIENGQLAVTFLGAGSKGTGTVYLEPEYWQSLTDDGFLNYLAYCMVNNQQLSKVGKKLYG